MKSKKKMKIIFSGGGTIGPVTPLIAIYQDLLSEGIEMKPLWIGTYFGPEKQTVQDEGIKFISILSGKLRRYFSLWNFIDPVFIFLGFIQSIFILIFFRPKLMITAGGYVSVPLGWAAFLLRIPIWVHQQDVRPSLANRLLSPFANKISITFKNSAKFFSVKKTVWTGNPVRRNLLEGERDKALKELNFESHIPVVLFFGGGTGATAINKLVYEGLQYLVGFCQIIHITGKGRDLDFKIPEDETIQKRYRKFEFLTTAMKNAYACSDVIVSRSGMGTISEIASLQKAAIIIPMPDTHQEENAQILKEQGSAIVLNQKGLTVKDFVIDVKLLCTDSSKRQKLILNLNQTIKGGANQNLLQEIKGFLKI